MRIQSVQLIPYQLPFRQIWQTSHSSLSTRSGWLIKIMTESGLSGYGDCAPLPSAGTEQPQDACHQLEIYRTKLQDITITEAMNQLPENPPTPAARCGVETALLDLISQSEQQSLRHWLSPSARDSILVNSMIGPLNSDSGQQALAAISQGFRILKLKTGLNKIQDDIQQLEDLCSQLPASVKLRLDANGAWHYKQAEIFIKSAENLPIESIEEPLKNPDLGEISRLQDGTSITLALDESIKRLNLNELFEHQAVQRLMIKPMVHGGLLPALKLARRAEMHDIETVITSTIETNIGLQALAQLAAAIPSTKEPMTHGLATSEWLINNIASAPVIIQGKLRLTDASGLGLSPDID